MPGGIDFSDALVPKGMDFSDALVPMSQPAPAAPQDSGALTTVEPSVKHPIISALAQEGLGDLNEAEAKAQFGVDHPWINAIGDTLSMFPAMLPGLSRSLAENGFLNVLKASLPAMAKRSAIGASVGGGIGGVFGGAPGARIGAVTGALGGGMSGYGEVPLTLEQQADKTVARQLAVQAAKVRAGIAPPSGDDIAEVLRQEFLAPPKKSAVPQNIPLPKATAPTFVRSGVPGAPLSPDRIALNTLAQKVANIGAEVRAGLRPSPEEDIEDALRQEFLPKTASTPVPQNIPLPKASQPTFVPSGVPGSAGDIVARQNALNDIRNATINRPGWVSKLPDRATFAKLPEGAQRAVIDHAIMSDEQATHAIVRGARVGSAGDLTQWKADDLWSGYMRNRGTPMGDSIASELQRRGLVASSHSSIR